MGGVSLWLAAQAFAAAYCLTRAVFDFRKGRAVWGVLGIAAGLAILLSPIPKFTTTVRVPVAEASG